MKRIVSIPLTILIIMASWWLLSRMNVIPSLPGLFQEQEVVIEKTGISLKEIKTLAQLITVSAYDELVADSTKTLLPEAFGITSVTPPIVLPKAIIGKKRLVLIGKTTTHIGINMEQLKEQDIYIIKDSIHLNLPKAVVLDVLLNPSDVDIFIEEGNWENEAVMQLKDKIRVMAANKITQRGLLIQAERKAKDILTNFFITTGFKKVTINFQ